LPTFKPNHSLPLHTGKIHFMRQVDSQGNIKVLNAEWAVPEFDPTKGVWATLDLQVTGATLLIYDTAPDAAERQQLASYPFQIDGPVLPWSEKDVLLQASPIVTAVSPHISPQQSPLLQTLTLADDFIQVGQGVLQAAFNVTAHLTERLFSTMY